jgi:uncharacterized membrane protein YqjE
MKTNQKFLIVFSLLTVAFIVFTLMQLPLDIIIQFNTSAEGTATLSKYFVVVLMLILSAFIGFQLYDEKNANDYARWYISGIVIIGVEIFILIVNT